ncbi:hypothetical protein [Flavobacterium pectinovorum]|uniref:Uncharacterized protein n=1 Tax=Flavobacterium pectinovorum TaxID=29533 RepID=A0A502EYC8_9FLAO|nr:hypothetical protein [Flavobacterium pectinovorum]TPG41699.1 hypothetical protein EAH81_09470 [Flavobacterium pectinovorum]
MLLTLDINQMAEPIVQETRHPSFLIGILSFVKKRFAKKISSKLDFFILELEGSYLHVEELDQQNAEKLLFDTKKIIADFYIINEDLKKDNYFDNDSLSEKFNYLFKTLYKFESKLHKIAYKDVAVTKTPDEILNGISKINKRNLSKLVD